jgi:hypothetical protein
MTEPIDELLEWLHTFDGLQFSCNHRNVIEKIWQIKSKQQLLIPRVSNSLDLVELERKIDEALDSETSESLKEWLHSKRQLPLTK